MRLKKYKRFVESGQIDNLIGMLEQINGFDKSIDEEDDLIILTIKLSGNIQLDKLESLFSQVSDIEKQFPDVTWQEDDGNFIFEFYV
jgi:hypothetical protein